MIRVLIMIAVVGFMLSLATLSAAVAIGGPDAITRGGWNLAEGWSWKGKRWGWDDDDRQMATADLGAQTTRTIEWSGADRLDIDLAADVRYIQSTGAASVVVTGPQKAVEQVVVRGDSIRYERRNDQRHRRYPTLTIVIRAPGVTTFDLSGRNTLSIEDYRQPSLRLDVSGSAEVKATGQAEDVQVDLSGSGEADLGALRSKNADVEISGSADAIIAPTERARLEISGSGDVEMLTSPKTVETDISGSGKVRQRDLDQGTPAPSPPVPPKVPAGAKT